MLNDNLTSGGRVLQEYQTWAHWAPGVNAVPNEAYEARQRKANDALRGLQWGTLMHGWPSLAPVAGRDLADTDQLFFYPPQTSSSAEHYPHPTQHA
jgi:hypothetical protein